MAAKFRLCDNSVITKSGRNISPADTTVTGIRDNPPSGPWDRAALLLSANFGNQFSHGLKLAVIFSVTDVAPGLTASGLSSAAAAQAAWGSTRICDCCITA
jgi:hypothetical protein